MVNYSRIAGMAGYGKSAMQKKKKGKIVTSMSTRKPSLMMNPRGGTADDFRAKGGRVIDKPGRVKPKVEGKPTSKSTSTSKDKKAGPLETKMIEKIKKIKEAKKEGKGARMQKGEQKSLMEARKKDQENAKESQRMTKAQRLKMILALRKKRKRGQR